MPTKHCNSETRLEISAVFLLAADLSHSFCQWALLLIAVAQPRQQENIRKATRTNLLLAQPDTQQHQAQLHMTTPCNNDSRRQHTYTMDSNSLRTKSYGSTDPKSDPKYAAKNIEHQGLPPSGIPDGKRWIKSPISYRTDDVGL
ncbi:hypothetical protein U1Q18_033250 [Sarracenia purpurea var. burkii]